MNDIERLRKTIRDLHGCDSRHLMSVPIRETFEGKPAWEGNVEVFFLIGHPKAGEAYAWSYEADNGESRDVAVLGIAPVTSAREAVRSYTIAEVQKPK